MIYLKSTDNFVHFPRTNSKEFREYTLKFVNQTTQTTTVAKHLQNTSNNSSYYILSVLDIVNQLVNGQYDYYILEPDSNAVIESGVCQFGEYQVQNTMAYNNTVKINSYNPYIPPTPKPKKTLDVSLNGEYDVEEYDLVDVDVFVPEAEVVTKTYDDNGKYMIKPSSSDKVMSEVDVTVNVPKRKEEQVKSITIQSSGDYTVTPDEGKVLSEVDINVPTFKETYDFNEIGYTNDLIDFNSDIAISKRFIDVWNSDKPSLNEFDTVKFIPNIDLSKHSYDMYYGFRNLSPIAIAIEHYTDKEGVYQYIYRPFYECTNLQYLPPVIYYYRNDLGLFEGCSSLRKIPKVIPLGGVVSISKICYNCSSLEDISNLADILKTETITDMLSAFVSCTKLKSIPAIYAGKCIGSSASYQKVMYGYGNMALSDFGGFIDAGKALTVAENSTAFWMDSFQNLTSQSVDNIADTIYDMTEKGFSPTMKFHSTVYNNMTDEQKAKFAAKNWTVVSA